VLEMQRLADQYLHRAATRITTQLMFAIRPALRGADARDVTREIYALVRAELAPLDKEQAVETKQTSGH
jgi:hypothetical protein